jgi:predicted dehydrogenase
MLVLLGAGHASYLLSSARPSTSRRCRIVAAEATCDVICVGAGVPKRGMGWYHAKQILDGDTPSASLSAVVEPWFLGPGADSPPGATFAAWAAETGPSGVAFCESVADVPKPDGPRMALISGRTADNPRLLREVIEAGCTAVYLEKPGAPTVEELEAMRKFAAEKKVPAYMG